MSPRRPSAPVLVLTAFALLHLILAATVDASDPDLFLRADRAHERLRVMDGLLQVASMGELRDYLASHGIVGDYAAHAALYLLGGRPAIVWVQIALALLSGFAVYRLGLVLGLNRNMATLAMGMYLSLPHTLVFPHQLVTEALQAPLFVVSNWLLAEGVQRSRPRLLGWSAVCLGVATLIRPITLLWPVVAAGAVAIARRPRAGVFYACLAAAPVIGWMSFVGLQTGQFGLGESGHSMGRNLYERVVRISATMPAPDREAARKAYLSESERRLSATEYLRFMAAYPASSLRHLTRDAAAFFGKSGVERITIDYLALGPDPDAVQDEHAGWRRRLELHGPTDTLGYLWRTLGPVLLVSLGGAAFMVALVVLAVIGAAQFLRRWREVRTPEVLTGLLLTMVVIYTFAFSQVLNAMQSRQRAPAEFALVLLAVTGLYAWRERRTFSMSRSNQPAAMASGG